MDKFYVIVCLIIKDVEMWLEVWLGMLFYVSLLEIEWDFYKVVLIDINVL